MLLLALSAAAWGADTQVETVSARPGVTMRFLFLPQAHPLASVILLAGGSGNVGIGDDGSLAHDGNFLVRTREAWRAEGFQVAVVDVPSDQPAGMSDSFRQSAEHAADLAAVAAFLRQQAPAPVWLVGTSRGTISAAAAGIRLGDGVDGVVLTSSIVRGAGALSALPLDRLAKPVLLVHHRQDECKVTPFGGVRGLLDGLSHSPVKALIAEEGGQAEGDPCQPWGHHGYNGIEDRVVSDVAAWIKAPKPD
ncbi:MAG: alpha/beta hydrolase [Paludibacterium sp.]|nr:alpha/beta hydrolase [Paludibacterium sp.]MBV8647894.1 alpha/beta hydrolase [Paludibacterium sp.]